MPDEQDVDVAPRPPEPTHPPAPQDKAADAPASDRVAALEAREKDLLDRLARMQADFENFRRRAREESAASKARGKEDLLRELLPLLDNLDRALAHGADEGLRLLSRQLHDALRAQGVTVLAPEGEAFDAKLHEAISQEARDGAKAGTVLVVAEKGYLLDGRVLRPARVVVAA